MNKLAIFISLFILFQVIGFTQQQYDFKYLSIEDGLSQSVAYDILQDSRGYIWIATQDGLNRYDGYKFHVYQMQPGNENSLSTNIIRRLIEDKEGNIWIGTTGGGVNKYNPITDNFTQYLANPQAENALPSAIVGALYEDFRGRIWIGTNNGLSLYRKATNDFVNFQNNPNDPESLPGNTILAINGDDEGNLWIGINGVGLVKMDIETKKFYMPNASLNNKLVNNGPINSIDKTPDSFLWLSTANGLAQYRLHDGQIKWYIGADSANSLVNNAVNEISWINGTKIWIATLNGISILDYSTDQFINLKKNTRWATGLSSNQIYSIEKDNTGVIWLGTTNGLNKFDTNRKQFFTIYEKPNNSYSLNQAVVFCFEEIDNKIWMGTQGGGINIYNKKTGRFNYLLSHDFQSNQNQGAWVRSIHQSKDGTIWIGTNNSGLLRLDENYTLRKRYTADANDPNSISVNWISDILETESGEMWFGTIAGGLCRYRPGQDDFRVYMHNPSDSNSLPNDNVRALAENEDGDIWITTQGAGVSRLTRAGKEPGVFINYQHNPDDTNSIAYNNVFSVYASDDEKTYFGTYGRGLSVFNKLTGQFTTYTTTDGLPNNIIYSIIADSSGHLWLGTNNGISHFNPKQKVFTNYNIHDGLQSDEFNTNAAFMDSEGIFYFGGVNGISFFKPQNIENNKVPPKLKISALSIHNRKIYPGTDSPLDRAIWETDTLILNYQQASFSFELTAFHYASPGQNIYKYRMVGLDTTWMDIENRRHVSFTTLPPKTYRFEAMAANGDGIWTQKPVAVTIIIHPPFYRTWWFYAIVVLVAGVLVLSIIKWREKQLRAEKEHLESVVKDRTHEVVLQKEAIEKKNKEITSSISYASRIQSAILPNADFLGNTVQDYFIYFKPRDIVSGDFYFIKEFKEVTLIAAADCTGHGVPGAFMSMLGVAFMNEIVRRREVRRASQVLEALRVEIQSSLKQHGSSHQATDGMDIALCVLDKKEMTLQYAGAHNPLYIFKNGQFSEIKADRIPIASYALEDKPFTNYEIDIEQGDVFYIFSDGYTDQFGGQKVKKFTKKRLRDYLTEIQHLDMAEQKKKLESTFENWKSNHDQIDDVLVIGVRV